MAKAALALGINGIMMEVRENPEESWSDKKQCVSLMEFKGFMREIGRL
jgi:3-deoxy-D-arabino-heptulosonate 7-phosphate (DAHP) synthase